jgi:hypothetical protein
MPCQGGLGPERDFLQGPVKRYPVRRPEKALSLKKEEEMERKMGYFLLAITVVVMIAACSKPPAQELDTATASVKDLAAAGAEKYAPEDLKKLNDQVTAANDEIKAQEGKWFKSYDKAKEMLAKVKTDAETLKPTLAAKKEEAKKDATAAQEAAKAAVDEAKNLLAKAPVGKESRADIEAMKADVKGLEESLTEVQNLVTSEDYRTATDKAKAISEKAGGVSGQVKQAMEKVAAAKKGKAKK